MSLRFLRACISKNGTDDKMKNKCKDPSHYCEKRALRKHHKVSSTHMLFHIPEKTTFPFPFTLNGK